MFVENPNNLPEVNHLDAIRDNNVYSNLEWCTHKENVHYSIRLGNHFCTRDLTGKNNPNYDNHILHEIYSNNPELAIEKLSRKGSQNGRAKKIKCIDENNNCMIFDWIGGCADYLIQNYNLRFKQKSIQTRIWKAIKFKTKYLNCSFEYVI